MGLKARENKAQAFRPENWIGLNRSGRAGAFRPLLRLSTGHATIEMHSELNAADRDVTLSGDPEHAGAQFRPANDIVAAETEYFFHKDGIDPKKNLDLPWVGESFRLATGKARHSVVILNHPDNPKNTRFSASSM